MKTVMQLEPVNGGTAEGSEYRNQTEEAERLNGTVTTII